MVMFFVNIQALLSMFLIVIPILSIYAYFVGIFFYPTSTVELHPKEIRLKKGRKQVVVPVADVRSIAYVTSRSTSKRSDAPVWVYYRLIFQLPCSKIKKIYFRDYVTKPPKASFGEWKKKVDRSEEFMTFIKTGIKPENISE